MVRSLFKAASGKQRGAGARLILVGVWLASSVAPLAAADDSLLAQLAGNWVGRGKARISPTADEELVYCKITNSLVQGGAALEQKGRCAVATNSSSIKGLIKASGNGSYQGTLQSMSSRGPANVAGSGSGNQINLTANFTDRRTGKPATAAISIAIGNGRYQLVSANVGPNGQKTRQGSEIVFTRQ